MSYQVLARKYRPMCFADVIGQEHVTVTLKNAILSSRIHHAYLFCGARGVGKTTVARILAKSLNCSNLKDAEPCGECRSCLEISAATSLDVQEIDGASNTSVDDVREIREHVQYLPSSGKYKIYIIDEVHMLSTSAFNALLKTLEEPPAHVVFIFATTEPQKIPSTILSRCQRYDFRRISTQHICESLMSIATVEKVLASEEALYLIARESAGSMRDAQSLFDQAIAFSAQEISLDTLKNMLGFLDRKILFDLLRAVVDKDVRLSLKLVEDVFSQGADLNRFCFDLLECFRHLLVLCECGNDIQIVELSAEELAELQKLAGRLTAEQVQQMFSLWYEGTNEISRSELPKILLEVMIVRLCRVEPVKKISELLSMLEEWMGGSESAAQIPQQNTSYQVQKPKPAAPSASASAAATASVPTQISKEQAWEAFARWLAVKDPKTSSIFQHGEFVRVDDKSLHMKFDSGLYADMLSEPDRKTHIELLLKEYFKRPLALSLEGNIKKENGKSGSGQFEKNKQLTREALHSSVVKDAAEILGAQVHDVRVLKDE